MCVLIKGRQVHMSAYVDDTCILVLKVLYMFKERYINKYKQVFS
jgi:hypothetical protein